MSPSQRTPADGLVKKMRSEPLPTSPTIAITFSARMEPSQRPARPVRPCRLIAMMYRSLAITQHGGVF
jgi:hypothetical protein